MTLGSLRFQEESVCATMLLRMNASLSSSSRFQSVRRGGEAAKPTDLASLGATIIGGWV
jgi:hypothetical protein